MALEIIVRLIISAIFVYAGAVKLLDPEGMRRSIEAYQLVGGLWAWLGAYLMPALELVAGMALWWKPARLAGSTVIVGMLLFFIGVITSAWVRGLELGCGCFGDSWEPSDPKILLVRDFAMLILAAYLWLRAVKHASR